MAKSKKAKARRRRLVWVMACSVALVLLGLAGMAYYYLLLGNIRDNGKTRSLYVWPGSSLEQVIDSLKVNGLENERTFRATAALLNYGDHIKPGHYQLKPGMGNRRLVNMLKSGTQTPVRLTFPSLRTRQDFARVAARQLMCTEEELLAALDNANLLTELGVSRHTLMALFLPDSYELYWTLTPEELLRRMKQEHDKWWTADRKAKARELGLTPVQVSIVASIVQAETNQNSEKPDVAGVYLNRLRKGMRLEADPTIKFALQDFAIKRILNRHLEAAENSPWSTYAHAGLPPGPINCPDKSSLDAVLNARKHDYLFFCASAEKPGFHTFSRTLAEHNRAAKAYHEWLNRQRIYE
ncbi:MAG: endolytic transglycosylase MltG [Bacteroidetes bacterium]|nr:endolytic transglycosylase MltG [Bacteroidota bacterium]